METAWIQVFVLTFAECVAPVGKSVCQPQQFELQFLTRNDCEYAMQQMIEVKDQLDYVIIDRSKTRCVPSAVESSTYPDLEALQQSESVERVLDPENTEVRRAVVNEEYSKRLETLRSCEDTNGTAPCKIGDIIVEEARGDEMEVWRRD